VSALKTPAADAPAEEWGALAESIPGWADLPGDRSGPHRMPRLGPRSVPDPDHWAWWGWFITLLRPTPADGYMAHILPPGGAVTDWRIHLNTAITGPMSAYGTTLGRACIAAAAALGRWPGGAS